MASVAIQIIGGSNNTISECHTNGFDIGIDIQGSENNTISNNYLASRVTGVRVRNSKKNHFSNNRVSQFKTDRIFLGITLRDLIAFLLNNTNINNAKIIEVYSRLGRSEDEIIFK